MCGLTGYAGFTGAPPTGTAGSSLKEMTETLACRGPDATAGWSEGAVGLGHTRLAIVDLEGGRQPLVRERGGRTELVVVFAGEVYNHTGLRRELTDLGCRFRTRSDSEVVLHAVATWGESAPSHLEGMFAYAAWHPVTRRLTLARDRLGIKPLCYALTGDGVVFGSEPKAVLTHPGVETAVDLDGFRELLLRTHPMIKTPGRSPFAGLREVRPGTTVTFTADGVRTRRYWSLAPAEHPDDLPTTVTTTRSLLADSVRAQLRADVPVCVLLSGGLDSSAIAALARTPRHPRQSLHPLHTLSVDVGARAAAAGQDTMARDPDGPFVDLMAAHLGSVHRRVALHAADLAAPELRDEVGRMRDGLTMGDFDTSLLSLFRAVREHFTVTLSGEGADELFGGYRWFSPSKATPDVFPPDVLPPDEFSRDAFPRDVFPWEPVLARADVTRLLDPALVKDLDLTAHRHELYREASAELTHLPGTSAAEAALRLNSHLNLTRFLPCLLDRTDRLSMGIGLEVRVPFLDSRLVEYVFNTPWHLKTFDGREKTLLRAAVADLLPEPVLARRKSPYPLVRDPRYRAILTAQAGRVLAAGGPAVDLLDRRAVRRLLLEADGEDRFPREGLEFVLDLDHWLRTHRPALRL
ncbi:asparagine synthase (glutamine-hydrolyzing) [Streptomyces sp. NPDC057137]|uniref:asparagine synthase (glutamine-hydrolyzing) n=1 Tax=Streptomyces sp. NPDC057137 TaxID=3346030 RepID=UPI003628E16A